MSKTKPDIPNDDELLAFVEELQTPREEETIHQQLSGRSEVLIALKRLRADRLSLRNITDPEPPEGIIDDCLAAVERELLISDDPIAPPVQIPNRRLTFWHRYVAAAVFFIVAGLGITMIYRTIMLAPNPLDFVGDSPSSNTSPPTEPDLPKPRTFAADKSQPTTPTPKSSDEMPTTNRQPLVMNNSLSTNEESRISSTADTDSSSVIASTKPLSPNTSGTDPIGNVKSPTPSNLKPLADDVPFSLSNQPDIVSPSGTARDIGLGLRLAVINRDEALNRIRTLLKDSTKISLIYNQPRLDTLPSNRQLNDDSYQYWSASVNNTASDTNTPNPLANTRNPAQPSQYTTPSTINSAPSISSNADLNLIPLTIQHDYRNRGFEYTLIGTPTRLHTFLQSMKAQMSNLGRLRILRNKPAISKTNSTSPATSPAVNPDNHGKNTPAIDNKPVSIESLMRPPHPRGRDWARSIFWWDNPSRNFPLAVQLIESYQPEPIIRIPLRIVSR